ncbi:hypothetical protein [Thiolinea disciformis]|uniref:hypothetical protein n=1 Tax=Thiolinea disciformis TaxID=125614 RepID=UPI00035DC111|nr:hypothetical protein [Thiolinea disciformis]
MTATSPNSFKQSVQLAQLAIEQRVHAAEPSQANALRATAWVKWINRYVLKPVNPKSRNGQGVQA